MFLYSTAGGEKVALHEAILRGFAPGGGLYLPCSFPRLSKQEFAALKGLSFLELAIRVSTFLWGGELSSTTIEAICEQAFSFPLPFRSFSENRYLLELFHGPTLSFKDIGARFLAAYIEHLNMEITVLVATSGDTGSAVGQAFRHVPGAQVVILFPKGRVTQLQRQQLTRIGGNVRAVEVEGTFEECQQLLKKACLDPDLQNKRRLTTGNSINIGRLFPQAFYFIYAASQVEEAIFSVPSGNFGHLVSGLFAKRMGAPIARFLAATNINDEVPQFLKTGEYHPHTAYPTVAVSMDVGDPSNFPRLEALFNHSIQKMRQEIEGFSYTDKEIWAGILEFYEKEKTVLDPHTAVGYLALKRAQKKEARPGIFLATAHPAKFQEKMPPHLPLPVPEELQEALKLPSQAIPLKANYSAFKELLIT